MEVIQLAWLPKSAHGKWEAVCHDLSVYGCSHPLYDAFPIDSSPTCLYWGAMRVSHGDSTNNQILVVIKVLFCVTRLKKEGNPDANSWWLEPAWHHVRGVKCHSNPMKLHMKLCLLVQIPFRSHEIAHEITFGGLNLMKIPWTSSEITLFVAAQPQAILKSDRRPMNVRTTPPCCGRSCWTAWTPRCHRRVCAPWTTARQGRMSEPWASNGFAVSSAIYCYPHSWITRRIPLKWWLGVSKEMVNGYWWWMDIFMDWGLMDDYFFFNDFDCQEAAPNGMG